MYFINQLIIHKNQNIMKKLLCVLNLSGAMETRDFKNGANQKSHTIKEVILSGILLIMSSYFVMGQSNTPIIGYDKVAWSTTLQKVQEFYPNMKETGGKPELGTKYFKEEVYSDDMMLRYFDFFQDKLCAASVQYYRHLKEPLIAKLISIYGKFDEFKILENDAEHRIRRYNKNLTIEVVSGDGGNAVIYFDPTVKEKIEKIKSDNIKL